MNEKARAARNAYRREWHKTHPENVRRIQERYWTKKAEAMEAEAMKAETQQGKQEDADKEGAETDG